MINQKQCKGACQEGRLGFLFPTFCIFSFEFLDSSCTIEKLLLPREEWMTAGADFHTHIFLCIDRFVGGTTGARYGCLVSFRMDTLFHNHSPL